MLGEAAIRRKVSVSIPCQDRPLYSQRTESAYHVALHISQVFTSTSTIAFETFPCDEEAVVGESYLRADYRLSCNTTEHKWYMVYAGIMIVVSKRSALLP